MARSEGPFTATTPGTSCATATAFARFTRRPTPLPRRRATIYVTTFPCRACMSLVLNAGIVRVVSGGTYRPELDAEIEELATMAGVPCIGLHTSEQDHTNNCATRWYDPCDCKPESESTPS